MPSFAAAAADDLLELEAEETVLGPDTLAGMLEADKRIRNRLRANEQGKLMRWAKDSKTGNELVGQLSMTTIAMNVRALAILARYWCPRCKDDVKSPSIDLLRKQVIDGIKLCCFVNNGHQLPPCLDLVVLVNQLLGYLQNITCGPAGPGHEVCMRVSK